MSGPADLQEGFDLDATPPAGEGEDLTLETILREAGIDPADVWPPQPPQATPTDWQQVFGGKLTVAAQAVAGASGPRTFTVEDPLEFVADVLQREAGRHLGVRPVWVRFLRPAEGKGALFVLSAPHPLDGADLIAVAHRGMISRGLLRDVAAWAFCAVELSRITVRIPETARGLQDLARRAGFVFEGRNRDLYGPGAHGQTWAMSSANCPWLPHRARPAPQITAISFPSLKVH